MDNEYEVLLIGKSRLDKWQLEELLTNRLEGLADFILIRQPSIETRKQPPRLESD